jgi:hypothetical protein
MAKLTTKRRKSLPDSAFAYPERRLLPIGDAAHVRAALGRFAQTQFPSIAAARTVARRILKAAKRCRVTVGEATAVARMAAQNRQPKPARRNPSAGSAADQKTLAAARRISEAFHGTRAEVYELSPEERKPLPRYVVALGRAPELAYEPDPASKRGRARWVHQSGDRGPGLPRSANAPMVVVDPTTRRPAILSNRSPMKLDPKRGLVG